MRSKSRSETIKRLTASLATVTSDRDSIRNEYDREERRLTAANVDFQLRINNLEIERGVLVQALADSQEVRCKLQNRVQSLEWSMEARAKA